MIENEIDEASKLLNEAAIVIAKDSEFQKTDWSIAAIVYNFVDGRKNAFGYVFQTNNAWEARLPEDSFDHIKKMLALQAAMEKQTGKKWLRALIHIWRDTGKINITFEYDDPKRWQINPSNLEENVNTLRPD